MSSSRPVSVVSLCLVLVVSSLHICLVESFVNRTNLIKCYQCKGSATNRCFPSVDENPAHVRMQWCARPSEACYTMVQSAAGKTIYTRGCAHVRFCQFAVQVKHSF
uniref:Protein quiver n=1 Tax=Cacopsylla melanoneura TaxID=428564 RepID=A0A8D9EEC0_9HEMI